MVFVASSVSGMREKHENADYAITAAVAGTGESVKSCWSKWKHMLMLACLGVTLAGLYGCASAPQKKDYSDMVWPAPPEQPRISFVAAYHGQNDLEDKSNWKDALLGVENGGIALQKPYGVAASADGKQIYVTDTQLHAVVVFDLEKKEVIPLQTDAQGAMISPMVVRLDSQGRVFVTDSVRKEVLVFGQTSKPQADKAQENTPPEYKTLLAIGKKEQLDRPTGLALDEAHNRMYVADTRKHRIVVYDMAGKFLHAFGERGAEPGQLNYPVNLAVDRDGNLLVTDSGNFRIQVFDGKGKFLNTFGALGDTYGTFSRPKGVALDSDNNVYVVDAAFNNFQIFNREGKVLLFVGSAGRSVGAFWLPTGIFVDASDKVYVVDSINMRIQVFQYLKEKESPLKNETAQDIKVSSK